MTQIIQLQDVSKKELFQHLENIIDRKLEPFTSLSKNEKLSIQEVADECDVTDLTVHNWIKKGYIKAFKIGRRVYIKRVHLDEALKEVKSLKYRR
ncbi:helix-turn-helix domain-containing protein [Winogradskyella sp. SYSU M77433]|uniref:helix-turn-helix domain-containing protein n=1 Tax=Winogradskyella sp. SYSU M77433 TaxID=3042722 RepID=UPI00247FEECE|nr:helix-turn-helix domain-containing protein [Winogradskyella sp. SYSU M77433]MDH7913211.1 helix-turn-helix domain-containing protein [Winogradskyella sp. SYSU M77433]